MVEEEQNRSNKLVIFAVIGFFLCIFAFLSFWVGTNYSCDTGFKQGFKCVEPVRVGTCEIQGQELTFSDPIEACQVLCVDLTS